MHTIVPYPEEVVTSVIPPIQYVNPSEPLYLVLPKSKFLTTEEHKSKWLSLLEDAGLTQCPVLEGVICNAEQALYLRAEGYTDSSSSILKLALPKFRPHNNIGDSAHSRNINF